MTENVRDRFVTIRLSSELYEALKALARMESRSLQEIAREALAEAVMKMRIPERSEND